MTINVVTPEEIEVSMQKILSLISARAQPGVVPIRFKKSDACRYLGCGEPKLRKYIAHGKITPFYDDFDIQDGDPKFNAQQWFYRDELDALIPEEIRLKVRIKSYR
ncbi:MAG: hypothetical protein RJQ09_05515 [Cyclobacteriaceae bacterium]